MNNVVHMYQHAARSHAFGIVSSQAISPFTRGLLRGPLDSYHSTASTRVIQGALPDYPSPRHANPRPNQTLPSTCWHQGQGRWPDLSVTVAAWQHRIHQLPHSGGAAWEPHGNHMVQSGRTTTGTTRGQAVAGCVCVRVRVCVWHFVCLCVCECVTIIFVCLVVFVKGLWKLLISNQQNIIGILQWATLLYHPLFDAAHTG
jgi:hypothetical protein